MEEFVWGCFGGFFEAKINFGGQQGYTTISKFSKSFKTPKLTLLEKWEYLILLHKTILLATPIASL